MNYLLNAVLHQIFIIFFTFAEQKTFKIELVQALFRHGDRTPDKGEIYKTDPYDPDFYQSIGYGELTNIGMQRAVQVGQLLRKRYNTFIGEYNADHVYAYSTDYNRTKASLQLVLAGLFSSVSTVNSGRRKITRFLDHDFLPDPAIFGYCPKFQKLLKEAENLPEIKRSFDKYSDFLEYLRSSTGIGSSRILTPFLIANNLQAVQSMGLKLPFWISKEEYKKLEKILALIWDTMSATSELRKMTVGPMVKQFLKNMKNHKFQKKKIYLYSGHDFNIALLVRAHNFTEIPANPAYGSTVLMEKLRGSDDKIYVRMFLWTGVGNKLIKLKMNNCNYECPLAEYEKIVESLLPDSDIGDTCFRNVSLNSLMPRNKIKIKPEFQFLYAVIGNDILTLKYVDKFYIHELFH